MKKSLNVFLMFVLACFSGCSFYWNHDSKTVAWKPECEPLAYEIEDRKNHFNLGRLERGMDADEVYSLMGMPDLYGEFGTEDEDPGQVFFYYTGTKVSDGSATAEECTPLVMVAGKLAGWGTEYYKDVKTRAEKAEKKEVFER